MDDCVKTYFEHPFAFPKNSEGKSDPLRNPFKFPEYNQWWIIWFNQGCITGTLHNMKPYVLVAELFFLFCNILIINYD